MLVSWENNNVFLEALLVIHVILKIHLQREKKHVNLSGKEKKSEAGNEEEGSYGKETVGRSTVRIEESLFLPSFLLSDNLL